MNKINSLFAKICFLMMFTLFLNACQTTAPEARVLHYPITIVQGKTIKDELIEMANTLSKNANLGVAPTLSPNSWDYNITFRGYIVLDITYLANDGLTYRYTIGRGGNSNSVSLRFDNNNIISSVDAYSMMEMY